MPAAFVPHHALVTAVQNPTPSRWMYVLHGIFGSSANWRTFTRRLVEARPDWGLVLVDLRAHGLSQPLQAGASAPPPPPHTLEAVAEDLIRLEGRLGLSPRGVMGHSFGGKVALAYLARRLGAVERAFVLDADPGPRPVEQRDPTIRRVHDLLVAVPQPIPSREAFLEQMQAGGLSRGMAEWLAMNVRRAEDGLRLRLDLEIIGALLEDYFAADLWPVLEDPRRAGHLRFVLGGRSASVSPDVRARLESHAAARFSVRVLPDAGHWLQIDDPEGLLAAVAEIL